VGVVVEGGSDDQRRMLGEIFAGIGETAIALVRLGAGGATFDHVPTPEEDEALRGVEVELVEPRRPSPRTWWEHALAAEAFAQRSRGEGLPRVAWIRWPNGRTTLSYAARRPGPVPLTEPEIAALRTDLADAAAASRGLGLDVVRPHAHAWAATLEVEEPHAFLRDEYDRLLRATSRWRERCAGAYLEVRDGPGEPVLLDAHSLAAGRGGARHDVQCCSPLVPIGRRTVAPRCPVFG
jgi:hypothetical protein